MINQTRTQTKSSEGSGEVAALLAAPQPARAGLDLIDRAWIDFFDPDKDDKPERCYGDLYRMWLINPAVVQMCLAATRRKAGQDDLTSIDLGLSVQGQNFKDEISKWTRQDALEKWHADMLSNAGGQILKGLRILDLGCGLGYLAPILTGLGATYLGLDQSAAFIAKANVWWPSSCKGRATFKQFDLSALPGDPVKAAKKLSAQWDDDAPDIVLAINVLEYLRKPETLLAALRHVLAPKYATASAFFVTTNPDYYVELSPGDDRDGVLVRQEPVGIMIACLNRKVPKEQCRPMGRFRVSELLRDTGFITLQEAFLTVPPNGDDELHRTYEEGSKAVNLGLAPCIAFATTALPLGRRLTEEELKGPVAESGLNYLNDKNSPSYEPGLWRDIKTQGTVIALGKDQPLLRRHNLGGQMYVVVSGQFCARGTPESAFKPGSLFGELEANYESSGDNVRYGYYVNDVVAAEVNAEVFVVPTPLASRLVSPRCSLRANLFAKLREKVMLRNARLTHREWDKGNTSDLVRWEEFTRAIKGLETAAATYFYPRTNENPFPKLKNLRIYVLGRVAGALLELQEIEHRRFGRCPWAHCVLIDFPTLKGIANLADGDVNDCVRVLHHLGAIDAYAPAKEIAGKDVMQVVRKHFDCRPGGGAAGGERLEGFFEQSSNHNLWSSGNKPNKIFENLASACQQMVAGGISGADVVLTTLAQLNWLLFDQTPNFFVIRDLPLLRSLAYDPASISKRLLFTRIFSLYPCRCEWPKLEDLANRTRQNRADGRSRFYAAALCEFVKTDLSRHGGALRYSADVAGNGVPVPKLPDTKLPLK